MWHVSSELHKVSLQLMHRMMHCLLMLPPRRSQLRLKILYNIALLIYLCGVSYFRYGFNRDGSLQNNVSRIVDLIGLLALLTGHWVAAMELLWNNQSHQIEQQFEDMKNTLFKQFRHKVNLKRVRIYCKVIYRFVFIRVIILITVTIYNTVAFSNVFIICNLYSEILLTLRFCEFSMHTVLVLAFFQELNDAANKLVLRMNKGQLDLNSDSFLTVEHLSTLQYLHLVLWETQRNIEQNFVRSLIVVMAKNFVDTSVIPYWALTMRNRQFNGMQLYGITEELGKLFEIFIPCWICSRCNELQRQFRSIFHGISTARHNNRLNFAILRISAQLGQERSELTIGGFLTINNGMMGKLMFGIVSYFIICVQYQPTFVDSFISGSSLDNITTTEALNSTEEYYI